MTLGAAIDALAETINARKAASADSSYTAKLLSEGPRHCAKKLGEEAVEAVIAATAGDAQNLTAETADVLYHLLVTLAALDVETQAVADELSRRQGVSGLDEKASRNK